MRILRIRFPLWSIAVSFCPSVFNTCSLFWLIISRPSLHRNQKSCWTFCFIKFLSKILRNLNYFLICRIHNRNTSIMNIRKTCIFPSASLTSLVFFKIFLFHICNRIICRLIASTRCNNLWYTHIAGSCNTLSIPGLRSTINTVIHVISEFTCSKIDNSSNLT